jgi:DNA polymerase III subunit delta'
MTDWGVIGHEWAVRRLSQALERSQLAQSHLFVGPPGVGKAALARALARATLSTGARDTARTVMLVNNSRHPDLTWVEPATDQVLIEQVRDLSHTLSLAPVESRYRVGVIDSFHMASLAAQNAFLKTLEEPNPTVIIVLVALGVDSVLPTIASRCQVTSLRAVPAPEIEAALIARGVAADKARLIARLAQGRPGWAIRATEDEDILAARAQRLADLEMLLAASRTKRLQYAETLSKHEEETIQEVLGEWLLYWRDVARATGTPDPARLREAIHNVDRAEPIAHLGTVIPAAGAARMVRLITDTLNYLRQNVRPQLALDALLLKMPRADAGPSTLAYATTGPDDDTAGSDAETD